MTASSASHPLPASAPGPTLAVDFGTAGTKAVLRWPDGRTEALLFAGAPVLASGVFAEDSTLVTGTEAQLKAFSHPGAYEPTPKRAIGAAQVELGLRTVPVVELIAAVLYQVWSAARAVTGNVPVTVALTHPVDWTRRDTDVLQEAAWRAGMPTPRLVSDPVAAACYAVEVQHLAIAVGASLVVCDYGAGGFTATVVRRESTGYTVLASQVRPDAGGAEIDARLLAHLGGYIGPAEWRQVVEPRTDTDRQAALLIRNLVVDTKESLAQPTGESDPAEEINFSVPALSVHLTVSRAELASVIQPILEQTVSATRLAVRDAGLSEAALAAVFVVGGGGNLPQVGALLRERLGVHPIRPADPDTAQALGAARPTAVALAGGLADRARAAGGSLWGGPAVGPDVPFDRTRRDPTGLPPTAPWAPVFTDDRSRQPSTGSRVPAPPPLDWRVAGLGVDPPGTGSPGAQRADDQPHTVEPVGAQPFDAQLADAQRADAQALDAQPLAAQPADAQALDAQPGEVEATGARSPGAEPDDDWSTVARLPHPWANRPPTAEYPAEAAGPPGFDPSDPGPPASAAAGFGAPVSAPPPSSSAFGSPVSAPPSAAAAEFGPPAAAAAESAAAESAAQPAGFGPSGGYRPPWLAPAPASSAPPPDDLPGPPAFAFPQPTSRPARGGPADPDDTAVRPSRWDEPPVRRPLPRRGPGRRVLVLGAIVLVLVLAGAGLLVFRPWSSSPSAGKPVPTPAVTLPSAGPRGTGAVSYTTGDNLGPAVVDGAQRGGTLTVLDVSTLSHLDPSMTGTPDERAAGQLVYRSLTAVRTNPDGTGTVVGDLATHPGLDVRHDCTVWRYTLREGVRFADGSPVTAQDVVHGVARSFNPAATGSTTLQRWLAGDGYPSRYDGVHAPGVSSPDARTVEFTFAKPHCDMPYLASLPTTAPVPVATPAGPDYDTHPVSSGPYQVASFGANVLELSRNQYWTAATDPVRLGGPDKIRIQFATNLGDTVRRLTANAGDDQAAVSWTPNARGDAAAAAGTSDRDSTGTGNAPLYLVFNMSTVADLAVRQAISYAVDKQAVINTRGSSTWVSTVLTSITDPAHLGYRPYPDPYPHDPDKARTLLAGRPLTLTLAVAVNSSRAHQADAIKQALGAVGITVNVVQLADPAGLRAALLKPGTTWDLALIATGPSWPTAYRQLETLVDGRGGQLSTVNDPTVNARFDALDKLPADQQNAHAAELDEQIMTQLDPLVPIFYDQAHFIHGSRAGGVPVSAASGLPDLTTAYVTTS